MIVGRSAVLKIDMLKEVIADFNDRITTPVIIGIRTGYLQKENETKVKELNNTEIDGIKIEVTTPIDAAKRMAGLL